MPNWCENELEVTGPREDLDRFIQAVMSDRSKFDFDRVIPYPLAFKNQDLIAQTTREMGWKDSKGRYPRDGFNSGGYNWCIANWGTKWWVGDVFFADYGTSLEYRFDTAWSPPNPVVERLIKDWPTLDFELHYKEVGMGFIGLLAGKDGEVDCNRCEKYRSRLSRY